MGALGSSWDAGLVNHPNTPSARSSRDTGAAVHVADTGSGIEVSFSDETNASHDLRNQNSNNNGGEGGGGDRRSRKQQDLPEYKKNSYTATVAVVNKTTMSFREQFSLTQKVYRAQFNTATPAVAPEEEKKEAALFEDFTIRRHRVPLFGNSIAVMDPAPMTPPVLQAIAQTLQPPQTASDSSSASLFDDVLFMLRSVDILDEFRSVQNELVKMSVEIDALDADRKDLQNRAFQLDAQVFDDEWDIHRKLARNTKLTQTERNVLQDRRGLCLTIGLHNEQAKNAFMNKCGATKKTNECIRPNNCRDGGAAATIQHACLLRGAHSESAFFMSRDKGKSFYWGRLPDRLFRRMKNKGEVHHVSNLIYLAAGPLDSYYAEFRSGECWWGSALEDKDFHAICSDHNWDVARVAFGPCMFIEDERGQKHLATSWIILGRDGRAAWKNIPARLHHKLESRLASESAPVEVALGASGAYFIRFLDGSIDYCLPAETARVLQSIQREGQITSMSLNPDSSQDYIIRHR